MFRRTFLHGLLTTMIGATCSWKPPRAPVSVALTGEAMQRVFPARAALFAPPVVLSPTTVPFDYFRAELISAEALDAVNQYTRMRLRETGFFRLMLPPNPIPGE